MNLDEAIKHAEEVGEKADCLECRIEHMQLANWLKELRYRRENDNMVELELINKIKLEEKLTSEDLNSNNSIQYDGLESVTEDYKKWFDRKDN